MEHFDEVLDSALNEAIEQSLGRDKTYLEIIPTFEMKLMALKEEEHRLFQPGAVPAWKAAK